MRKTDKHVQVLHDGCHLERIIYENEYKQRFIRFNHTFRMLDKFDIICIW